MESSILQLVLLLRGLRKQSTLGFITRGYMICWSVLWYPVLWISKCSMISCSQRDRIGYSSQFFLVLGYCIPSIFYSYPWELQEKWGKELGWPKTIQSTVLQWAFELLLFLFAVFSIFNVLFSCLSSEPHLCLLIYSICSLMFY